MKNKMLFLFLMLFSLAVVAKGYLSTTDGGVVLQLQSEQWVTTNTAEVIIGIDATLDKLGLLQARDSVLKNLSTLAKVDWHLTEFSQFPNESGLEQLHIAATARIPEAMLTSLRDQAKAISKPGLAFHVSAINFTPSLAEIENTKASLRSELYAAAQDEAARLNKVYHDQKYVVHSINFAEVQPPMPPMAMNSLVALGDSSSKTKSAATVLAVSAKIQMTATVELTPNPTPEVANDLTKPNLNRN